MASLRMDIPAKFLVSECNCVPTTVVCYAVSSDSYQTSEQQGFYLVKMVSYVHMRLKIYMASVIMGLNREETAKLGHA